MSLAQHIAVGRNLRGNEQIWRAKLVCLMHNSSHISAFKGNLNACVGNFTPNSFKETLLLHVTYHTLCYDCLLMTIDLS